MYTLSFVVKNTLNTFPPLFINKPPRRVVPPRICRTKPPLGFHSPSDRGGREQAVRQQGAVAVVAGAAHAGWGTASDCVFGRLVTCGKVAHAVLLTCSSLVHTQIQVRSPRPGSALCAAGSADGGSSVPTSARHPMPRDGPGLTTLQPGGRPAGVNGDGAEPSHPTTSRQPAAFR